MPNHITNIITITGEQEKVQEVIDKCGTIHPRIPQTAYDGGLIFNSKDGHSYGWYYPDTDIFKRRDEPDVQGVPEGYTQEYREEFLQFPDFDKIIPMPESMHITSGSNVDNAIAVLSDDRAEFRRFLQYPAWQDMLQQASLPLTEDGMKEYM